MTRCYDDTPFETFEVNFLKNSSRIPTLTLVLWLFHGTLSRIYFYIYISLAICCIQSDVHKTTLTVSIKQIFLSLDYTIGT